MRNIALRVAYDGTAFVGSQWQNNGRSVQGELEGAWEQLTQERRRLILAGRTDAGVHAQGQVANVRTETRHTLATVRRGLNAILPADVAVLEVWEVPPEFHARHNAFRREYRYLIDNQPVPLPLLRHCTLHVAQQLDVGAVQAALSVLPGQHDFAAFATAAAGQGSTVRVCYAAGCTTVEMLGHELLAIDIAANAFLHHMIRLIVGTLLLVGRGRITPAEFEEVLRSRDRRRAGPTAPAHGLSLTAVLYPPEVMCR